MRMASQERRESSFFSSSSFRKLISFYYRLLFLLLTKLLGSGFLFSFFVIFLCNDVRPCLNIQRKLQFLAGGKSAIRTTPVQASLTVAKLARQRFLYSMKKKGKRNTGDDVEQSTIDLTIVV